MGPQSADVRQNKAKLVPEKSASSKGSIEKARFITGPLSQLFLLLAL
jgi:hypothetical protein